jgi:hypothetical protein
MMSRGNEIEVVEQMRGGRWIAVSDIARHRRAGDRPTREIDFIPMARVLPAAEFGTLRAAFSGGAVERTEVLTHDSIEKLSYIMGRHYLGAETQFIRGLGLPSCNSEAAYSGFDMGGGESSMIVLLSRLQSVPRGGLVVIEEVELGLHAEAQERLIAVLLGICHDRKVQIVCTTHSEVILDAVPRRARVLLRRNGDEHEALRDVSTRFAVHEMVGRAQPELQIYTEDSFAQLLVEESISGSQRSRVRITGVGSNVTLARQSLAHLRMQPQIAALSAFDGDCTEANIQRWLREERAERDLAPEWLILPADGLTPERWLIRELASAAYRDLLASELNCTRGEADGHIAAMRVQLDHHDCSHVLSERTGLSRESARRMLVRSVARTHPGLEPLRQRVNQLLDDAH